VPPVSKHLLPDDAERADDVRILLWHVHGSWTTGFVQGGHEYLLPVLPDRSSDGVGRAQSWDWPSSARELSPQDLRREHIDVVVLQRPHELDLVREWTGRTPGRELPAVYLEHNVPGGRVPFDRHPMADQSHIPVVHVTHFNALLWDTGKAPVSVIDHGVIDPGQRYVGDLARAAVVVNEPVRRGRAVGTDLVLELARDHPVDVFGIAADLLRKEAHAPSGLRCYADLDQERLHVAMARRRVYLHPNRWTSLGLSLVEAMMLGMPVVAVASTETAVAVPPEAGVVTTRPDDLARAVRMFCENLDLARSVGDHARAHALERFGLGRFLRDWDLILAEVTSQCFSAAPGTDARDGDLRSSMERRA
jgi:glycosyltransferase involved in cell wall biosynthesis